LSKYQWKIDSNDWIVEETMSEECNDVVANAIFKIIIKNGKSNKTTKKKKTTRINKQHYNQNNNYTFSSTFFSS
jgi:hypothetical protein